MKKFIDYAGNETYVGTAQEIRALYGSMRRAVKARRIGYMPFSFFNDLKDGGNYELQINPEGFCSICKTFLSDESVNKKALRRFICQEAMKRCRMLREDGYEYICTLSERSVSINGVVDVPFKEFLDALKYAQTVGIKKELCIHVGNLRLWVKPTDEIEVL